jgi:hypothetical protein
MIERMVRQLGGGAQLRMQGRIEVGYGFHHDRALLRKLGVKKVGAGGTALKLPLFSQLVGLIQGSGSHSLQTKSPQLDIA